MGCAKQNASEHGVRKKEHQINTSRMQLKGTKKLHHLRLNNHRLQNFDDLSETMANIKEALNNETSFRPENRNDILEDETSHAKRCCSVSTFIARVSRVAINMVGRDVKIALQA